MTRPLSRRRWTLQRKVAMRWSEFRLEPTVSEDISLCPATASSVVTIISLTGLGATTPAMFRLVRLCKHSLGPTVRNRTARTQTARVIPSYCFKDQMQLSPACQLYTRSRLGLKLLRQCHILGRSVALVTTAPCTPLSATNTPHMIVNKIDLVASMPALALMLDRVAA